MPIQYTAPEFQKTAFNCPHCDAFAQMEWESLQNRVSRATCARCKNFSLWITEEEKTNRGPVPSWALILIDGPLTWMIYPLGSQAPLPNPDMPDEIKKDYEEARTIASLSPRGAAALLRLCIQKLCIHLGEKGKDINHDIGELVKKGLRSEIQKALDIVRVTGNNAVHPRELNDEDIASTSNTLFILVNRIVNDVITEPRETAELYTGLPEGAREGIEKRDGVK